MASTSCLSLSCRAPCHVRTTAHSSPRRLPHVPDTMRSSCACCPQVPSWPPHPGLPRESDGAVGLAIALSYFACRWSAMNPPYFMISSDVWAVIFLGHSVHGHQFGCVSPVRVPRTVSLDTSWKDSAGVTAAQHEITQRKHFGTRTSTQFYLSDQDTLCRVGTWFLSNSLF